MSSSSSSSSSSSAAAAAPAAALPPGAGVASQQNFAVDTSLAQREVWLVKVPVSVHPHRGCCPAVCAKAPCGRALNATRTTPMSPPPPSTSPRAAPQEVVAELVHAASEAGGGDGAAPVAIGEFATVGAASAPAAAAARPGQKRPRVALKFALNKALAVAAKGPDGAKAVPTRFSLSLDAPAGQRVLAHAGGSFAFAGVASRVGALVPDMGDPAYGAYMSARRAAEKRAAASKAAPRLADGPAALGLLAAARATSDTGSGGGLAGIMSGNAATERLLVESASAPAAPGSQRVVPKVGTIYALFEAGAYWSLREMAEATGRKEPELRADVATACDYIRQGPHKGRYRLKPEWRTTSSSQPEPNDGIGVDAT